MLVFTLSASAQSIVGKWDVDASDLMSDMPEEFTEGEVYMTFDENSYGSLTFDVAGEFPIDDTTIVKCKMGMDLNYLWIMSDDNLTLSLTDTVASIKSIEVVPENPEYTAMIPMIREMFEKYLGTIMSEDMAEEMESIGALKVEFVSPDEIVLYKDGEEKRRLKRAL